MPGGAFSVFTRWRYLPHFVFVHALQQVGHESQQVFPQQLLGQHLLSEQQDVAHDAFAAEVAGVGLTEYGRIENAARTMKFNMVDSLGIHRIRERIVTLRRARESGKELAMQIEKRG